MLKFILIVTAIVAVLYLGYWLFTKFFNFAAKEEVKIKNDVTKVKTKVNAVKSEINSDISTAKTFVKKIEEEPTVLEQKVKSVITNAKQVLSGNTAKVINKLETEVKDEIQKVKVSAKKTVSAVENDIKNVENAVKEDVAKIKVKLKKSVATVQTDKSQVESEVKNITDDVKKKI